MEKTDWVKTQVKFLGHLISDQGVTVPQEFSQIIKDWPLPKTLKDLRSFLGKCNYYRSHFQNFAIIAAPLMTHLKGSSESSCKLNLAEDPKAVASFQALKELLMSPQLLAYPDLESSEPFIVDTNFSHDGIGTICLKTKMEQRGLSLLMPDGLSQGCQTQFGSGAAWSKIILPRAKNGIKINFFSKKPPSKFSNYLF